MRARVRACVARIVCVSVRAGEHATTYGDDGAKLHCLASGGPFNTNRSTPKRTACFRDISDFADCM